MNRLKSIQVIALLAVMISVATSAQARKYEVLVSDSDVVLSRPGQSEYVFEVTLPAALDGLRIDYATLEIFIEGDSAADGTPFVVTLAPLVAFTPGDETYTKTSGVWPSHLGVMRPDDQHVKMNVTSVLKQLMNATGPAFVVFEKGEDSPSTVITKLRTGAIAPGVVARINVHASRR